MTGQRRLSRRFSNDGLSFEQRLVLQLSAAMNHDDQGMSPQSAIDFNTPEDGGHATAQPDISSLLGSLSSVLGNASGETPHANAHLHVPSVPPHQQLQDKGPARTPPTHAQQLSLDALNRTRNTQMLSNADAGQARTPQVQAVPIHAVPGIDSEAAGQTSGSQNVPSSTNFNTDINATLDLLNSLGSIDWSRISLGNNADTGAPSFNLGDLRLSDLGLFANSWNAAQAQVQAQANQTTSRDSVLQGPRIQQSNQTRPSNASIQPPNHPMQSAETPTVTPHDIITGRTHDSTGQHSIGRSPNTVRRASPQPSAISHINGQRGPGPEAQSTNHFASPALSQPSRQETGQRPLDQYLHETRTGGVTNYRPDTLSFDHHIPTAIDPEVSSIQSVLQSLLMGAQNNELSADISSIDGAKPQSSAMRQPSRPAFSTESTQNTYSESRTNTRSDSVPTGITSRLSTEEHAPNAPDFSNMMSLGLSTEDRSLIESLRSAISGQTTSMPNVDPGEPPEALPLPPQGAPSDFLSRSSREARQFPAPKAKRAKVTERGDFAQSGPSTGDHQDFNASDPDTLRAIQQALLGAMGPDASNSSLAETMTGSPATQSAIDAVDSVLRLRAVGGTHRDLPVVGLPSGRPTPMPATDTGPVEKSLVKSAKKPVKITKPIELDKQKLREENAARKRKWREGNLSQNKDNDLRTRITKRANELYGDVDSVKKSQWIDEEFERRRQRRILRAGINSIVDAAKARAAKAASEGEHTGLAYGRFNVDDNSRTLTQQSKQAASSHLSQLFRNSNAALEPQLHNDKVSVPLAPYMLVSSPGRPLYKLNRPKTQSLSDSGVLATQLSRKSTNEPSETSGGTADAASLETSSTALSTIDEHQETLKHEAVPAKDNSDSVKSYEEGRGSHLSPNQKTESRESMEVERASPYDERPKHRYSLIGDLKLGIPPNLTSIYHRIRGTTPQKFSSCHSSEEQPVTPISPGMDYKEVRSKEGSSLVDKEDGSLDSMRPLQDRCSPTEPSTV